MPTLLIDTATDHVLVAFKNAAPHQARLAALDTRELRVDQATVENPYFARVTISPRARKSFVIGVPGYGVGCWM